jgi:hypothetical protein
LNSALICGVSCVALFSSHSSRSALRAAACSSICFWIPAASDRSYSSCASLVFR